MVFWPEFFIVFMCVIGFLPDRYDDPSFYLILQSIDTNTWEERKSDLKSNSTTYKIWNTVNNGNKKLEYFDRLYVNYRKQGAVKLMPWH